VLRLSYHGGLTVLIGVKRKGKCLPFNCHLRGKKEAVGMHRLFSLSRGLKKSEERGETGRKIKERNCTGYDGD